ncbi:MAG TPA: hypothetical protein VN456_15850 [Desulfosporosinus sp.]|nr:hypothetical protein [Desulfosporosinus sp.]
MRYSRALKGSILKKVMPPENRSVTEVSRDQLPDDQELDQTV